MPSDDTTPGGHQVVVISHAFWMQRLAGGASVLGQWMEIEQKPYQIIGVAEAGFTGAQPGILTDAWLPNMMFDAQSMGLETWNWLQIWGRLAPDTTRADVQPIVRTTLVNAKGIKNADAEVRGQRVAEAAIAIVDASTGLSYLRRDFERPLVALAVIVGVVLLIACSNIANLLLARGAARTREMALRASIGAGRGRLVQQVLMESSVLTLAAAACGVLCASLAVPLIVGMLTTNENPVFVETRLDLRVVAFVAALGSLTTILFGLVPAIRASAATPGEAFGIGSVRYTVNTGTGGTLVAAQIAFSLMILFVASLLLRSFDRLLAVDLGFTPERVTLLSIEARDRLAPAAQGEIGRQLVARLQAIPGVDSASAAGWALFRGWSWGNDFRLPSGDSAPTQRLAVSNGFFRTMNTRMLDGREFQPSDTETMDPRPLVVNEAFARRYFPDQRAIGQRMTATQAGRQISYEIVGVAANARDGSVRGTVGPYAFSLLAEPGSMVQIRSSLDPTALVDQVRRELPRIHPSLRLVDVTRQSALVMNTLLRERLLAVLSGFFAALGLALAAVGLYGVLSYAVVRRTREIGIRLTLGAQPGAVVRAILSRVLLAVIVGTVLGLAGGAYFATFLRTFLFEIEPGNMASIALPVIGLLAVALIAAWSPARRATRVDPAEALRME